MPEQFISEPIQPVPGSFDTRFMTSGVPGLPREFSWRGKKFTVVEILRTWRATGPCRHGSGEQYTRRHWFEIKTASHNVMQIYFDKGPRGKRKEMGWFLFTIN
jgi:phosphoribosylglycinamide formyltransferase-1